MRIHIRLRLKFCGRFGRLPINGYGWHKQPAPPTSQDFVAAQGDWYRKAIDLFSPARCMFESNFPVDKVSLPYRTLWNAFKLIAAPYSEWEKDQMFHGAATAFYRLREPFAAERDSFKA